VTHSYDRFKIIWKLLAFRLLVAGIVTIFSPWSILSSHPAPTSLSLNVFTIAGLLIIITGSVFYLRCVWDFAFIGQADNPNNLVVRGTYKIVRNPMYASLVLILLGESLAFKSLWLLGYALGVWVCIHLLVTFFEERILVKKFGATYKQYCKEVSRWILNFKSK
jgi:protein-S-isoprenylcysteine O-methyltransferase Ste14